MKSVITEVRVLLLLSLLVLTGCADMILPQSNRIWEERTVTPATSDRYLILSAPLDWFASENGDRYDIFLPQGQYLIEAEDSDYLYYRAVARVTLGKKKFFSTQDNMPQEGGIFFSKRPGSKYSSGAYVDYEGGKKLLVFFFDFRFTTQEGKQWHFSILDDDPSKWTIELTSSEALPSGPCRIYDASGRLMLEGTLAAGKMDGNWTAFTSRGDKIVAWSYHNGQRNGSVQMWYGPFAYPEANGRLNVEGAFLDGAYDGIVKSYYPSGAKISVRVYDRGTLTNCQYWSAEGVEFSSSEAVVEANHETKADLDYIALLENNVTRSLSQAHRRIRQ
jgi:hypothetical protein